jgi:adenosine deaminase
VQEALGLGRPELAQIARNAIEAAFLDEDRRAALLAELEEYLARKG